MTMSELLDEVISVEGVHVRLKTMAEGMVIIFWKGHSPIAHVYENADEYSLDYPKLYEMNLEDILHIDAVLYEYVNTDLENREI